MKAPQSWRNRNSFHAFCMMWNNTLKPHSPHYILLCLQPGVSGVIHRAGSEAHGALHPSCRDVIVPAVWRKEAQSCSSGWVNKLADSEEAAEYVYLLG